MPKERERRLRPIRALRVTNNQNLRASRKIRLDPTALEKPGNGEPRIAKVNARRRFLPFSVLGSPFSVTRLRLDRAAFICGFQFLV